MGLGVGGGRGRESCLFATNQAPRQLILLLQQQQVLHQCVNRVQQQADVLRPRQPVVAVLDKREGHVPCIQLVKQLLPYSNRDGIVLRQQRRCNGGRQMTLCVRTVARQASGGQSLRACRG